MIKEGYQGEQFQTFLKTLWNKYGDGIAFPKNLSVKSLCEGVCDVRMLRYLKKGERVPDKLLRERLLERLDMESGGMIPNERKKEFRLTKEWKVS